MLSQATELKKRFQRLTPIPAGSRRTETGFEQLWISLQPCLSEERVAELEQQHGFTVPEEYRVFVTQVGNGMTDHTCGPKPLERSLFELQSYDEDEPEFDRLFGTFWPPEPDDTKTCRYPVPGSLPICELGCGSAAFLAFVGPETGSIWLFLNSNEYYPYLGLSDKPPWNPTAGSNEQIRREWIIKARSSKNRVGFFSWCNDWLDSRTDHSLVKSLDNSSG